MYPACPANHARVPCSSATSRERAIGRRSQAMRHTAPCSTARAVINKTPMRANRRACLDSRVHIVEGCLHTQALGMQLRIVCECVCATSATGRGGEKCPLQIAHVMIQYHAMTIRTNLRNKGLISADRRTSLLSCLQYPVPYLSRLQRIYLSQCFTCDDV